MAIPNIRRQEISAAAKVHRDLKPENILLTSKAGKRAAETGGMGIFCPEVWQMSYGIDDEPMNLARLNWQL